MITAAVASLLVVSASLAGPVPEIANHLPNDWQPAPQAKAAAAATEDKWIEAFPGVRLNRALKAVEFDGKVAWDFHNADTPRTELELLVCLPMRDKEHESLVLSKAKGAHVHAALLMVGLEPGKPGSFDFGGEKLKRVSPTGPAVSVTFNYLKGGQQTTDNALDWVIDEQAKGTKKTPQAGFVFAGSGFGTMKNELGEKVNVYNADELGTLVGLCTFGTETVALTQVVSPDSGIDAPRYIGNNAAIPPADTAVRVRIQPVPAGENAKVP